MCAEGGGSVDKTSALDVSTVGALTPTQRRHAFTVSVTAAAAEVPGARNRSTVSETRAGRVDG